MQSFFFDTYAFIEILQGNPRYDKYKKNIMITTTKFNLMELHYSLLRTFDINTANWNYNRLVNFCTKIDDDTIKKANEFKFLHKKRKLSYVDCIGYVIAIKKGIKFLTGDIQFKDLDNVEYVK